MSRPILFSLVTLVTCCTRNLAAEFAGPQAYRAGDSIITYRVPSDLVSAHTRVERVYKGPKDRIIFTTAYSAQSLLFQTAYGNFTMGVIPTPEGLRPDRSVRALNDYYSLYLSSVERFVETTVERTGDREWLHVVCRPREKPDKISSILHYTEISADFILYIGLGSGTSAPLHSEMLKKLPPLVEQLVASVRISRVGQPEKPDGVR
ncbi:MAG: hypothetical protein ACKOTE_19065 [Opitutaceae bacterium]